MRGAKHLQRRSVWFRRMCLSAAALVIGGLAGLIGVAVYLGSLVAHVSPYWWRFRWAMEDLINKVWD